jgi:hypothetical protein
MATVTESDNKRLEEKLDKITSDLTDIKVSIVELKGELKGDIKALNETVKGIDKRLNGLEILNRIVGGGIIVGILLALFKYLFLSGKLI